MATKNNYIAVAYTLYVRDEDEADATEALAEQCDTEHPFQFISGLQSVLPAFESQVCDKQKGASFDFRLPSGQAYGPVQDELMFDVERSVFEINGRFDKEHIFEGNIIPLQGEDGQQFNAVVIEVKPDAVTIDLNHPRAGQELHFVGTVVENREATADEITGMLNLMSGESCGCHCGECGGECADEHGNHCHDHHDHEDGGCHCGHYH